MWICRADSLQPLPAETLPGKVQVVRISDMQLPLSGSYLWSLGRSLGILSNSLTESPSSCCLWGQRYTAHLKISRKSEWPLCSLGLTSKLCAQSSTMQRQTWRAFRALSGPEQTTRIHPPCQWGEMHATVLCLFLGWRNGLIDSTGWQDISQTYSVLLLICHDWRCCKKVPECHTLGEVVQDVRNCSFGVSLKCVQLRRPACVYFMLIIIGLPPAPFVSRSQLSSAERPQCWASPYVTLGAGEGRSLCTKYLQTLLMLCNFFPFSFFSTWLRRRWRLPVVAIKQKTVLISGSPWFSGSQSLWLEWT